MIINIIKKLKNKTNSNTKSLTNNLTVDTLENENRVLERRIEEFIKNPNKRFKKASEQGEYFEKFIAAVFEFAGYKVQLTSINDKGIDIYAENNQSKYLIQCKNYNVMNYNAKLVGVSEVREFNGVTESGEKLLITTSYFTGYVNKKDFKDRLTWLFGHARGSKLNDHRMFNDVNYYDKQEYMDSHKYVVIETPERKYYYEAAFLTIVPETTSFYRIDFENDEDFLKQLRDVKKDAKTKNNNVELRGDDKYVVLSTCREEDETIRANLYLRQIPDKEMDDFLAKHKDELKYVAKR